MLLCSIKSENMKQNHYVKTYKNPWVYSVNFRLLMFRKLTRISVSSSTLHYQKLHLVHNIQKIGISFLQHISLSQIKNYPGQEPKEKFFEMSSGSFLTGFFFTFPGITLPRNTCQHAGFLHCPFLSVDWTQQEATAFPKQPRSYALYELTQWLSAGQAEPNSKTGVGRKAAPSETSQP